LNLSNVTLVVPSQEELNYQVRPLCTTAAAWPVVVPLCDLARHCVTWLLGYGCQVVFSTKVSAPCSRAGSNWG